MESRFLALSLAAGLLLAALPGQAQAPPLAPDWLDASVEVRFANLTHASLTGAVDVHRVDLGGGSARSAEDLRAAYRSMQLYGADEQYAATLETALRARLEESLASLLRGEVDVDAAELDRASLEAAEGPDPFHPPLRFTFDATVDESLASLGLSDGAVALDEAKLRSALGLGAVATLPYNLTALPGWNVSLAVTPPDWVRVAAATQAKLAPDGAGAAWELRNWHGAVALRVPASLTLAARSALPVPATDAHVALQVDMEDVVGLTLPGALSGDLGALDVAFLGEVTARALRLEDFPVLAEQVEQQLPASVRVEGFTADALRVALRDDLLPPDALAKLEAHFRAVATQRIAEFGPEGSQLDLVGSFAAGTFDEVHVSEPLDTEPPLVYRVEARFRVPLSDPAPSRLQAAGAPVLQRELAFDLPRAEGLDTTYRLTLPPGIGLAKVDAEHATFETGSQDGRDYVLLTPQSQDAHAVLTLAVTTDFVLAKFWYLWLGIVIAVAAAAAVLLLRRQRKRAKPAKAEAAPVEPAALASVPLAPMQPAKPVPSSEPPEPGSPF